MFEALTILIGAVFMRDRAGCTTGLPSFGMGGNIMRSGSFPPRQFRHSIYLLSAVSGQGIWSLPTHLITTSSLDHYLLTWSLPPHDSTARSFCTLSSSTSTCSTKGLKAVLCQWKTSYTIIKSTIEASCHIDSLPWASIAHLHPLCQRSDYL